jgi:hypothetical protein
MSLSSIAAAGINDGAGHFLAGWHERTRDGRAAIPYRASAAEGALRLARVPGAKRVHVLLSAPVGVAGRALTGAIAINDTRHALRLDVDAWVLRTFPIPANAGDELAITFHADTPVIPDELLRNGDGRALGWYVSIVWQS